MSSSAPGPRSHHCRDTALPRFDIHPPSINRSPGRDSQGEFRVSLSFTKVAQDTTPPGLFVNAVSRLVTP